MATYIPFQPVLFGNQADPCISNTNGFSMPVLLGDSTQFQFLVDGCSSASEIINNGSFSSAASWLLGTNWTIASGSATHTAGAAGTLQQLFALSTNYNYKVIVSVNNMTAGSLEVRLGGSSLGTITADGVYTFFHQFVFSSTAGIRFIASSDCQCDIESVSVLLMNRFMKVVIYNPNGTQAAIIENADGYFTFSGQYWTTTIDWGTLGIPYGCYYIGIADECDNTCSQLFLAGQDFFQESFWTQQEIGGVLTLASQEWTYTSAGAGLAGLTNISSICPGKTYIVSYKIKNVTGTIDITIAAGSTAGTTRTADGTYTDTIISNGAVFSIGFLSSTAATATIYDLTVTGIDAELVTNHTSNRFLYTDSFPCSHMLTAVCNENSLGMGFVGTGFIPRARIESKGFVSSYPQSRVRTRTSLGEKRIDYFESDKTFRLKVLHQPEHILDFLAVMVGCDHWYIDGTEFFFAEEEFPEPKPNKFYNLYDLDLECQKKTLLLVNKNCDDRQLNGILSADEMVTAGGRVMATAGGVSMTKFPNQ